MKKSTAHILTIVIIIAIIFWTNYSFMPQNIDDSNVSLSDFSTNKAIEKLKIISKEPHYVGTENHKKVGNYLIDELKNIGLDPIIQEGFTLTKWGNITKSKNIIARIKGSGDGKAVLLLSHYDSAPHSKSYGASDDGVGIVTILETLRAFKHNMTKHTNDVIVLFSDAEELGLNGAALFVKEHPWAKDVGIVLNLEARGTKGPSYMLLETNGGNANILQNFVDANPAFPTSNSLMYSIYKLLPNDTDLTIFRENANIPGFNFAFIDNHFNYHTSQDHINNISPNTIKHQGTYLVALLNHFGNASLDKLQSDEDYVYFNTPIGFFTYSFKYNYIILGCCFGIFLLSLLVGFGKRVFRADQILKGFIPLILNIIISGFLGFLGWKVLLNIYPDYTEMLHGFTYNGHSYIWAFSTLTLAIGFFVYRKINTEKNAIEFLIAPILLWLIINLLITNYLPGGSFFIIPTIPIILYVCYYTITQKTNYLWAILSIIPLIMIVVPFVSMFPIGLGLKIMFGSMILISILFSLSIHLLGSFTRKNYWSIICLIIAIGFFTEAHLQSNFEPGKGKPNSLVYILDHDQKQAYWSSYDLKPDDWTKNYLGENPDSENPLEEFNLFSKYNTQLNLNTKAPLKNLEKPTINFKRDTVVGDWRHLTLEIKPNRKVNRYDVFANENVKFYHFKSNGITFINQKNALYKRNGSKLLSYYVVDQIPLELKFIVKKDAILDLKLLESSFDLLENSMFTIPKRPENRIAKPFVLNDAIVAKMKIQNKQKVQIPENEIDEAN